MRAVIVSVGYADLLAITLPYNASHFTERWVVTTPGSDDGKVAKGNGCKLFETDAFTERGAVFNKWIGLEQGLDAMGRHGWLCQMDADVLWPKDIKVVEMCDDEYGKNTELYYIKQDGSVPLKQKPGQLCSPLRRMWNSWPAYPGFVCGYNKDTGLCQESCWQVFPIHPNVGEWAGYSQIFHASDPVLGEPPWHEVDWIHAGGADSMFQRRWAKHNKVRPSFEVLHLGPAGQNWFGRATPLADGTVPEGSAERAARTRDLWMERRVSGFTKEKLT